MTGMEKNTNSPDSFLTFRLGPQDFGVDAASLWEISTSAPFSHIPRTTSYLVGVTHFHGKIIPVIDLPSMLELSLPPELSWPSFIALEVPPLKVLGGFYVTRVLGFEKIGRFIRSPRVPGAFVTGEVERAQGSCRILDLEGLWKSIKPTPLALQTIG